MKIALIGASGWLGHQVWEGLRKHHEVITLSRKDISNWGLATCLLSESTNGSVQFVVNCAGFTGVPNVDQCELLKDDVLKSNVLFPASVAEICEDLKIPLGHISSGCVFDGPSPGICGWKETEVPNFGLGTGSFYSASKLMAEYFLKDRRCYIWRIRMPFNDDQDDPKNFLAKLLGFNTVVKVHNSITYVNDLIRVILAFIKHKPDYGIYHVTQPAPIPVTDICEIIRDYIPTLDFKFFESYKEFSQTVKAPRSNCILDTSKLGKTGIVLTNTTTAIRRCVKSWF